MVGGSGRGDACSIRRGSGVGTGKGVDEGVDMAGVGSCGTGRADDCWGYWGEIPLASGFGGLGPSGLRTLGVVCDSGREPKMASVRYKPRVAYDSCCRVMQT